MNFPLFRVSDSNNGFALTALEKLRAEGFSPLIALHLGAGAEFRNWGALNFAHTMRILLQESNLGIVLIGSNKSEADLVLDGLDTQNGIINLIGKTDIDQLAGVLAQVDLLIGVDSGPLHLACAVGTKTLGLYFASAWLYETGPLGEGHYILQAHPDCTPCVEDEPTCDHCPCRDKINPALVARTILKIMANDEWNDLDLPPEVTLFQTQIDDLGQYYHPLKGEFKDGAKFYHTLWPSFFENLQHLKLTTDD